MKDKEYDLLKDGTYLTDERVDEIIREFDLAAKEGRLVRPKHHPLKRKRPKEPLRVSYYRLPKYIQNELKLTD